MKDYSVAITRS